MASRTDNLGLIKPDLDDNIDVTQLNANSDVLDFKVQQNSDNIEIVRTDLTAEINKRLPLTGGILTGDLTAPNININNNLTFNGDTTHKITTPVNSIELGDTIRFVQGDNYFEINNDGACYIGGNGVLQTTASELNLMSNGGTNFAINDNGEAYLNGNNVMRDIFTYSNNTHYKYTIYKVSAYTMILQMRIYPTYGTKTNYRSEWVTFPIPFKNADYAISTTTTDTAKCSALGHDDNTCGGLTSTGCYITIVPDTETSVLIIGRIG